jgi:4-hydroxy-tetrahydrodipicolinate synthase
MLGLYTALITPFLDGNINLDGFADNLQDQLEANVDGVVVLGTTGETPTLTPEEQELLITTAVDTINGEIPVYVGTGTNSTATTLGNTRRAERLGADGVLVIAPYYNKPTQEGIYQHFLTISESSELPIVVYNHPGRTGTNIEPETLFRMADLYSVIGVKDASPSLAHLQAVLHGRPEDFLVFAGDDATLLPLMAMGGNGLVSVASNVIPMEMRALVDMCADGDFLEARNLFERLYPIFQASAMESNPIPIKAMMDLAGNAAGPCRLPLTPPTSETVAHLQKILESFNGVFCG